MYICISIRERFRFRIQREQPQQSGIAVCQLADRCVSLGTLTVRNNDHAGRFQFVMHLVNAFRQRRKDGNWKIEINAGKLLIDLLDLG